MFQIEIFNTFSTKKLIKLINAIDNLHSFTNRIQFALNNDCRLMEVKDCLGGLPVGTNESLVMIRKVRS